jgi:hypothetical protein
MPSILEGVPGIIDQVLGLDSIGSRAYTHLNKQACVLLCRQVEQKQPPEGSRLVHLISERIAANREELTKRRVACRGGRENWRFEVQPDFELGVSYEIRLQKAIAVLLGKDWANAIPTASGLTEREEKARCIDLVQRLSDEEWRFVELKAMKRAADGVRGEQTPLFACLELLQYALIFDYSQLHSVLLGYTPARNPILAAKIVHLEVLMTQNCYFHNSRLGRFNIGWLHGLANEGLNSMSRHRTSRVQFDFRFSEFPEDFEWTEDDHRQLHSLLVQYDYRKQKPELERHPDWLRLRRRIGEAIANRVPAELN